MQYWLNHLRPYRTLLLGSGLLVGLLAVAWWSGETQAQIPSGSPQVTSVNVSTTSNSALIQVTTDLPAKARIKYGTSVAYGLFVPADGSFRPNIEGEFAFTASGLSPATTYHYVIETTRMDDTGRRLTGDRTFTTQAGAGGGPGGPSITIDNISVTCVGANCQVAFSTNVQTNVELRYDLAAHPSFNNYTLGANGEPAGSYSTALRAINLTGLSLGTTYHYRLRATDAVNNSQETGDLTFSTPASSQDRTFTTGACSFGGASYPIGSCLPDGGQCAAGAQIIYRCDLVPSCGFRCAAGQTCTAGGSCQDDPPLTGSPYQCNKPDCYNPDGTFQQISGAGCYASWPRCTANTVLKVRKDRACNLWLSCGTSLQTEPQTGRPSQNLCLSLSACNSLNANGQCNNFLPPGQCKNDPLRFCNTAADCQAGDTCSADIEGGTQTGLEDVEYASPGAVNGIANLSGNVIAGLNWNQVAGVPVISGALPWQLMQQLGSTANLRNGDLEEAPPSVSPWSSAPVNAPSATPNSGLTNIFEDRNNLPNHVLLVEPAHDPNQTNLYAAFAGAAFGAFQSLASDTFFGEARVRAVSGKFPLRLQFGSDNYQTFTSIDFTATTGWQRFQLGPVTGLTGQTWFAIVCPDVNNCGEFWVDDVKIGPVLQINTNPTYTASSCRIYPKEDSPSCSYVDSNGISYQGWRGYCLEHDSVTGTCLSWWPLDLIKGQSDVLGAERQVGYADRTPLFYCAEAAGNGDVSDPTQSGDRDAPYYFRMRYGVFNHTIGSVVISTTPYTIQAGFRSRATVTANRFDSELREADIYQIVWHEVASGGTTLSAPKIINTAEFQQTSRQSPIVRYDNNETIKPYDTYRTTASFGSDYGPVNTSGDTAWVINGLGCNSDSTLSTCLATGAIFFDKNTGLLKSYLLDAWSNISGNEYLPTYLIGISTREVCQQIVLGVTASGQNQAFASRINSSSYRVPDLGYSRSADLLPYGGSVAPDSGTVDDPATWPIIKIEAPDVINFEAPGQARGGTPYSCRGNCAELTCTTTQKSCMTAGKLDPKKVKECQESSGLLTDQPEAGACTGVETPTALNFKGPQTFDPALPGAASAGACQVQTGQTCNTTQGISTQVFGLGQSQAQIEANATIQLRTNCQQTRACTGQIAACSGAGQNVNYQDVTGVSCAQGPFLQWSCTGTCTVNTTYDKVITGGDSRYFAQQHLRRLFVKTYGIWSWEPSQNKYVRTSGSWEPPVDRCPAINPSDPNTEYRRPGFPNDYCGVPPKANCADQMSCENYSVTCPDPIACPGGPSGQTIPIRGYAQFLNSASNTIVVTGGSGNVAIKFLTEADADQNPLQTISIDWGDKTDVIGFPFAPRNDPSRPHIIDHAYVVDSTSQYCSRPPGTIRHTCTYPIQIQVKDAWGWCNTATATSACPNSYVDTGLRVIVKP